jgi:ribonuclease P protein component
VEEKYWLPEEQKEENSYPLRPHICGLLFSYYFLVGSFLLFLTARNCMSEVISVKKNRDFQKVFKTGRSYANKYLVMYVMKNEENAGNRIGISVSKKVGNSVVRHRVKRLIKESYRLNAVKISGSYDIVVVARQDARDRDYSEIESALMHLCKLHHILAQ